MFKETTRDRRQERRDATRAEILEAAWELAREGGLAALSLRDLARRVGMQAPSLYSYFESKHAIYDAMFAQGAQAYLEYAKARERTGDPLEDLQAGMRFFVAVLHRGPGPLPAALPADDPGLRAVRPSPSRSPSRAWSSCAST